MSDINQNRWVSKKTGLLLKQVIDMDAGASGKNHQSVRYGADGPRTNAECEGKLLDAHATPDEAGRALLAQAAEAMRLTARGYTRVLRVARTIADLAGSEGITRQHVAEALSYRRQAPRS